jgi:hypothetical protein
LFYHSFTELRLEIRAGEFFDKREGLVQEYTGITDLTGLNDKEV